MPPVSAPAYGARSAGAPAADRTSPTTQPLPARGMWAGDWATDAKLKLVSDSYINFISVPRILDFARRESVGAQLSEETAGAEVIQYAHKISRLYRKRLGEFIAAAETASANPQDAATLQQTKDIPLAQELRSILHLAETFYLPVDGLGDGVVGEALVHWHSHSRPGPSSEIAEDFMSAATPYYNPEFLPYINKCILRGQFAIAATLMSKFEDHHPIVRQLASDTAQLISTIPRSPSYTDARKFLIDRQEWTERVKVLQSALQSELDEFESDRARDGHESDGGDERLDLEVGFMILLGTLAGDDQRILDASESWQEALAAWGLLVQPSMTRDDAPLVLPSILRQCGVTDDPADQVQAALVRGEPAEAASLTRKVDPWLAAHLVDLFERAGVLTPIEEADSPSEAITKLRNDATTAYAEMILEDQGLWRVAIDYFALAGPAGESRLREVLLTVPLTDEEEEAMGGPYDQSKGKGKGKDRTNLQGQGLQDKIRSTTLAHQKTMKRIRALNASVTGGTVWGGAEDTEEDVNGDVDGMMDEDENEGGGGLDETGTHTTLDPAVLVARREKKRRRLQREREIAARSVEVQRVEDVLEVCQEHGLLVEARAVCLKMADAMLRQERYSVALEYSARAREERLVGRIADFLIDQYVQLDAPRWLELVDQIPASLLRGNAVAPGPPGGPDEEEDEDEDSWDGGADGMDLTDDSAERRRQQQPRRPRRPAAFGQGEPVDSPRLQFLAKYREFYRASAAGQLGWAAEILVEVLSGRLAPYRFWAIVLVDAADLMEKSSATRPCFDTEQVYELMRYVEQICTSARRNPIEAKRYFSLLSVMLHGSGQRTSAGAGAGEAAAVWQADRLAILSAPEVDVGAGIKRMNVVRQLLAEQLARNTI